MYPVHFVNYVTSLHHALDLAASEMYIPEVDMYYIGPEAAGNEDGLVTNQEFTQYKLKLFKKYWRFISVEDWADENKIEHWEEAKQIIEYMIQMGDDLDVSRADLIEKYTRMGLQNAHLQKPNQSSEEKAGIEAVATSHNLGNVVVASHRGTRPSQEVFTAFDAIGLGTFGIKCTLLGVGRGPLIAKMTQSDILYNKGLWFGKVKVPYQGALVLDPDGPYKNVGWAKRVREEIGVKEQESQSRSAPTLTIPEAVRVLAEDSENIHRGREAMETLDETKGVSSPVGGIDLTKMKMLIQPQGSFASSSLDFSLPRLSRAEIESFDLDQELAALQRMASSGIAPNPERFKEDLAICFAQGRTGREIDRLKSCLEDVLEQHQLEARETPDGYKEVLVVADTRSYVLKEGRF